MFSINTFSYFNLKMLQKSRSSSSKSLIPTFPPRQKFILNWINTLTPCKPLTHSELPEKFRTGVFQLTILEALKVPYQFSSTKNPPKSREDCLSNINTFLSALQSKGLSVPSTFNLLLYQGKSQSCWEIVEFIFSNMYLPEIFEYSEDMFTWYSNICQCEISYTEILVLFKDGSLILKILNEFEQGVEFHEYPENKVEIFENLENIEKILNKLGIHFLFSSDEFYFNDQGECLLVQLWLIFKYFDGKVNKNITKYSTETSSKSSFIHYDTGLSESKSNIDLVEKKIVNEERKLMYLSDLRTGFELKLRKNNEKLSKNNEKQIKKKGIVSVPSVKEIPHSSSQPVLSNSEILICYLLTPRIIQVYIQGKLLRVLINFIPNESKFSLKCEKYLLELKELTQMRTIFVCEIEEIENFDCQGEEMYIWVRRQPIKLVFKTNDECLKYLNGFEYLLEKYGFVC